MTSPLTAAGQFASAVPYFGTKDINLAGSPEDQTRVAAYKLYEDMYYNRPETFAVTQRGEDADSQPIYIPSAKKIIEAMNRFLAKDFNFVVDPKLGVDTDQAELNRRMNNLFKRERMQAKFATQRRMGLIRGDTLWHITADPGKDEGKRLSVHALNPANYFPIMDLDNPDRVIGCHIVDVIQDPDKPDDKTKKVARRQTYLKDGVKVQPYGGYLVDAAGLGDNVTSYLSLYEVGKWDDRHMKDTDLKKIRDMRAPIVLQSPITTIPVYHWRNNRIDDVDFGVSEIAGIETLIAAINQSITDEDLTLIMQGLGMYWTNAKPPKNTDGTDGDWLIGPGVVVEVGDTNTFGRVTGVSSVAPFQEHIKSMQNNAAQAIGIPDIAQGIVDVAVAQSGIALALQLAPILASAQEKETEMLGVMDQMFYDIVHQWFPAYEAFDNIDVQVASIVGDAMPVNRDSMIQEILLLQAAGLITIAQAQGKLAQLGYEFNVGDDLLVIKEAMALAMAKSGDPTANRYFEELVPPKAPVSTNAGQPAESAAAAVGAPAGTPPTNSGPAGFSAGGTGVPTTVGANGAAGP